MFTNVPHGPAHARVPLFEFRDMSLKRGSIKSVQTQIGAGLPPRRSIRQAAEYHGVLFGIPVYTTTALNNGGTPLGTAVLLDSTKFGFGIIRQGIQLAQGWNDTDFSQFIQRYALWWRGQLAVVRPGAVLTVTGLPTSPYTPAAS
jgi:hypothetical protein